MQQNLIGTRLRKARLNRKISIEELQKITKIQKRYLEALEANDFDKIPGTFYVRAFIRQFAEAVGESGDELVAIFDGKSLPKEPAIPSRPKPEPIQASRKTTHVEERKKDFWSYLPMISLGLIALAIIFIVGYMMMENRPNTQMITRPSSSVVVERSSSNSTTESSSVPESSSSSTEESTTETSEAPPMTITFDGEVNRTVTMTANEVTSPATLTFVGTGSCWIGLQVNGDYIYQYTLAAGETQSTEIPAGTAAVTIVLGAATNVSLSLNDESLNFNPNNTAGERKDINLTLNYQQ